jgi:ankyrin repeat protein
MHSLDDNTNHDTTVLMNPADKYGITPLHWAALKGDLGMVKAILEKVTEKSPADNNDKTLLHCAAEEGHHEVVKVILEKFSDKSPADDNCANP